MNWSQQLSRVFSSGAVFAFVVVCWSLGTTGPAQAENVISMGFAQAGAGTRNVPILVTASHDMAIHGYSLAFRFPAPALRLSNISVSGTSVGTLQPDFVAPLMDNRLGVGTLGVIFDFSDPFALSELPAMEESALPIILARLSFDLAPSARGGRYDLQLEDGVGAPPGFNRFTHRGHSIVPELENGAVTITGADILALEKRRALPGATPNLQIRALAHHSQPLDGFQIAFTFNKNALTLNEQTFTGTDVFFELGEAGIEVLNFDEDNSFSLTHSRVTTVALFDGHTPFDGQMLSPSLADPPIQSLARYSFEVKAGAATLLQFQDLNLEDVGIPGAIDNRFIISGQSTDPLLRSGKIYFSTGGMSGRVVDAATGESLAGVTVVSEPEGTRSNTGGSGRYSMSDLPPGLYALRLTRPGYYDQRLRRVLVNGAGKVDEAKTVAMYRILENPVQDFVRGDCDGDGDTGSVTDAIVILNFNFLGGLTPPCLAACDVDGDGTFRGVITDAVYLLNFQFQGGTAPPAPYPACGPGSRTSDTDLGCERLAADCR
jgi:hypothetical protein